MFLNSIANLTSIGRHTDIDIVADFYFCNI